MILNETIKIDKYKKLRDSVHDIVTSLTKDEWLSRTELSNLLKLKFKIHISYKILINILSTWKKGTEKIFYYNDCDWLYYDNENEIVFNVVKNGNPVLCKSRQKEIDDSIKRETENKEKIMRTFLFDVERKEKIENIISIIPTSTIINVFQNVDILDVIELKKSISNSIKNNKLEINYLDIWKYMIDKGSKTIQDGGLGLELSNNWKTYKIDFVKMEEKDVDEKITIFHNKYGVGKIIFIMFQSISIDFSGEIKRFKSFNFNNTTIQKEYVKKPSTIKGYEIAYCKDLLIHSNVYNIDMKKEGVIKSMVYNKSITIELNNGIIMKMTIDDFIKKQNFLIKEKSKITNYNSNPTQNQNQIPDLNKYEIINNVDDLNDKDEIYYKSDIKIVDKKFKNYGGNYTKAISTKTKFVTWIYQQDLKTFKLYRKKLPQPQKNSYTKIKDICNLNIGDYVYELIHKEKYNINNDQIKINNHNDTTMYIVKDINEKYKYAVLLGSLNTDVIRIYNFNLNNSLYCFYTADNQIKKNKFFRKE